MNPEVEDDWRQQAAVAADASRASVLCLPQRPARGAAGEPAAPAAAVLSLTLARMLSHLLDSTTSLAARLPLPLPHLLSPPHTPRHPRGRGVPAPAAGLAPAPVPPLPTDTPRTMYGLGVGEAESADEDQGEEAAADLTAGELRRLQASPAFQRHLRSKGLTIDDLAELASRLHLYRRLRRLDPAAFWLLVPPQSRLGVESRTPGAALLAGDYLLSTGVNLLVALALVACLTDAALPGAAKALVVLLAWWTTSAAWVAGRTTAGRLSGLWYEELRWGHAPPAWRCILANLIEILYVVCSAGGGLLLSLGLRVWGRRRQGVGEMLAGVAAVEEVQVPLHQE